MSSSGLEEKLHSHGQTLELFLHCLILPAPGLWRVSTRLHQNATGRRGDDSSSGNEKAWRWVELRLGEAGVFKEVAFRPGFQRIKNSLSAEKTKKVSGCKKHKNSEYLGN